jgi:DNA topoisomerase III
MSKKLYISEKPSVAKEFAKALRINTRNYDGYMESEEAVVTWCIGHLVTMSYPEVYDSSLKKWSLHTLPFLPKEFCYEVIPNVKKQFDTVKKLLNRADVSTIYVCTDSGREGEYIYRLVDQMAKVSDEKDKRRVWIDSQTEDEILRGIKEAKPMAEYNNLAASAYLRAKEDYLMGINFSRVLTLKYGQVVTDYLHNGKWTAIAVGRVMTCVLGMVVKREREIRVFVKTPFYRVISNLNVNGNIFDGEWRAVEGSKYFNSLLLYKENGFKERKDAQTLVEELSTPLPATVIVEKVEKKKEKKQAPLLYNLAELQNDCSKMFKISPDETLKVTQELYEKKMVTYPRTDARVLSTAVSKEIYKNINGLRNYAYGKVYAEEILAKESYKNIVKTKYVNDKQITDHYAIVPTGQGLGALKSLNPTASKVYEIIVRRFLSIFYPPAIYQKVNLIAKRREESFFSSFKVMVEQGYLAVMEYSFIKRKVEVEETQGDLDNKGFDNKTDAQRIEAVKNLKKGSVIDVEKFFIKEGETSPPKRYSSGSMILAMENAGQLIEDDELRAQIKGSGIGTSATRAEILNKLCKIIYLNLNNKTQIITPTLRGEMIYDVVNTSIRSLLNPELTASWEKGLNYVADGEITEEEYMEKLEGFVGRMTNGVKNLNNQSLLKQTFDQVATNYK